MTQWLADRIYPTPINRKRWCRNGQSPDARFMPKVARGLLHACAYRGKIIAEKAWATDNLITGSATMDLCRVATHLGPQTTKVGAIVNLGPGASSGTDPFCKLTAREGLTGVRADVDSSPLHYGLVAAGTACTPNQVSWRNMLICEGLTPDTDHEIMLRLYDYCRPISISIFELWHPLVDDTLDGGIDPRCPVDGPITAARTEQWLKAATHLWRYQGQHHLAFIAEDQGPSVVATTYTSINDMSSTTVSASTPGAHSKLVCHNSASDTSASGCVPCRMAVYGVRTGGSGSGGSVKVLDSSGNNLEITGITSATGQWYETTGLLPAAAAKYDIHCKVGIGDTVRIDTVLVWEEDYRT